MKNNCLLCGKEIKKTSKHCRQCQNIAQPRGVALVQYKRTPEQNKKLSDILKGRKFTEEHRKNISKGKKGKKMSLQSRLNISRGHIKPGTKEKRAEIRWLRNGIIYKIWRKMVMERDNYTCQICKIPSSFLEVDHIIPFSFLYKEAKLTGNYNFIFDLSNGRTLCRECHKQTDTYGELARNHPNNKLFNLLEKSWKQSSTSDGFLFYYELQMEKIIEDVKKRLD